MTRPRPDRAATGWWWLAAAAAAGLVPVLSVFTLSRIFFVRDLGLFFWSRHLWLRHTVAAGHLPLWDPYFANGQAAVPDALNQLAMPLTLAIRLLVPSDVVSFNLWVTLPLPLAASGMFLLLRRRLGAIASFLGAAAFAWSGPMVSSLNAPNMSWSVAFAPWVLWSMDRALVERADDATAEGAGRAGRVRLWCLAVLVVALQAVSGEPVTLAATGVAAVVLAALDPESRGPWWTRAALAVGILAAGAALAAIQLLPTAMAGVRAHRGAIATPDFWSLHPLGLVETAVPHLYGNYYDAFLADLPWMTPLNSGREPFFYSIYLGPLTMLLAVVAVVTRPRRNAAWAYLVAALTVCAMGGFTPVYGALRALAPPLAYFRFPVKYIAIAALGVAALAADGFDALTDPATAGTRIRRIAIAAGVVATVVAALDIAALALPAVATRLSAALAWRVHVTDTAKAADYLVRVGPPLVARSAGLLLAGAGLLALTRGDRRHASLAIAALCVATAADLAVSNGDLNPTSPVEKMSAPGWYRALAGPERVYIGGRLRGFMNARDPDATHAWKIPAEATAVEGRVELDSELPMAPAGWGVREALSYDLPALWPVEYEQVVRRFEHASASERSAFLRRAAVKWCVLPEDRVSSPSAAIPHWTMALERCDPTATRVFVSYDAASGGDPAWQQQALFDPSLPDRVARLDHRLTLPSAAPAPVTERVALVRDEPQTVVVDAALPRSGIVVLRDSYDPDWRAEVDGRPAEIARANGLFRAVAVPAGSHVIRFEYRPNRLLAGLIVSGAAAILMALGCVVDGRKRNGAAGFTLMEMMIVLAIIGILAALAFARYRQMKISGDEAAALASIKAIGEAQAQFALTCGNGKYAASLAALAQPSPATGTAFLSPDVATDAPQKAGYLIRMTAKPLSDAPPACNGAAVADGFAVSADPARPGITGERYFGMNADRVVYADRGASFSEGLPESGAPAHGAEVK